MRALIDIPDEQSAPLAELCRRQAISRSEAIRRAIALYLDRHDAPGDDAFGLWSEQKLDGVEYQRSIREEWGR